MKKIIFKSRPSGQVSSEAFQFVEEDLPTLQEGQVLLKVKYLSVDPYMRNRMNNVESYIAPFDLEKAITSDGIAEVIESKNADFSKGDLVYGMLPWQEAAVLPVKNLNKIHADQSVRATNYLGVLGLTGLTAYFGMLDIGQPQKGETAVISGAAGAVGSIAGQIAAIKGCKVVGITGSEEKTRYLTEEIGFDAAIDYKKSGNIRKELRNLCPDKIDIYFDNVGGDLSDGVFYSLNNFSRVIICGQISLYNLNRLSMGPRLFPQFLIRRTKLQGFIVYDYADQFTAARRELTAWLAEGKIKVQETIIDGFENLPAAFLGLFSGENIGKLLVRI